MRTGPRGCAAGRLLRSRRRGADARPGSLLGRSLPLIGAPLSWIQPMTSARPAAAASAVAGAARTAAAALVWAAVFVGPTPRCSASRLPVAAGCAASTWASTPPPVAARRPLAAASADFYARQPAPGCPGLGTYFPRPRLQTCLHTQARRRSVSVRGVSDEQTFAATGGTTTCRSRPAKPEGCRRNHELPTSGRDEHREPLASPTRAS